jgi:hypothetical protein
MGVALERWRIKWSGETGGENEYEKRLGNFRKNQWELAVVL